MKQNPHALLKNLTIFPRVILDVFFLLFLTYFKILSDYLLIYLCFYCVFYFIFNSILFFIFFLSDKCFPSFFSLFFHSVLMSYQ